MAAKTIIQAAGTILSAAYGAYGLFQTATANVPAESNIHRWDMLIAFGFFFAFISWAIVDRELQLSRIHKARPRLDWHENRATPLVADETKGDIKKGDYLFNVVQIWFKNNPSVATDDAIAKDVFATATFFDRRTNIISAMPVCFVIGNARDHAGNTGERLEKIRAWSPSEICKLQLAVKRKDEESAFGFTHGDLSARELKSGTYYVRVLLEGTRVIGFKPIWFEMTNPGTNGNLSLEGPIKKPNLRKEGFPPE